jgi:hypothetical protein
MSNKGHSALASRAILRRPGEADVVDNPLGGSVTYWARSEETAGAVTVLEAVVDLRTSTRSPARVRAAALADSVRCGYPSP